MPERSYETYPVKEHIKYDLIGKEFGLDVSPKNSTEQYQKFLKKHTEKFNVYYLFIFRIMFIDRVNILNLKNFYHRFY